jgi:TctA family transporter
LISGGSFSIFFTRPFALVISILALALLVLPVFKIYFDKNNKKNA